MNQDNLKDNSFEDERESVTASKKSDKVFLFHKKIKKNLSKTIPTEGYIFLK